MAKSLILACRTIILVTTSISNGINFVYVCGAASLVLFFACLTAGLEDFVSGFFPPGDLAIVNMTSNKWGKIIAYRLTRLYRFQSSLKFLAIRFAVSLLKVITSLLSSVAGAAQATQSPDAL